LRVARDKVETSAEEDGRPIQGQVIEWMMEESGEMIFGK
jgi:hypothetical protein